MKRIDKIYRDKPDPAGLYEAVITHCCEAIKGNCNGSFRQCVIDYLNEEVPEYDAEFIEKLKAVKVVYPWAKYLAMDFCGSSAVYQNEPREGKKEWLISARDWMAMPVLNNYSNDWENSLIDIDKVIEEAESNDKL